MKNPPPSKERKIFPEQWVFSKETAFRIPQLMNELRESVPWKRVEGILKTPPAFIRRVLTSKQQDMILKKKHFRDAADDPTLFDFTFSDKLQNLYNSYLENKEVDLNSYDESVAHFFKMIKSPDNGWHLILDVLNDTHTISPATYRRLRDFSDEHYSSSEKYRFTCLSDLYRIYSRFSHFGYAARELTRIHSEGKSQPKGGSSLVMAYRTWTGAFDLWRHLCGSYCKQGSSKNTEAVGRIV